MKVRSGQLVPSEARVHLQQARSCLPGARQFPSQGIGSQRRAVWWGPAWCQSRVPDPRNTAGGGPAALLPGKDIRLLATTWPLSRGRLRWGAGLVPVVLCLQRELRKRTKCFSGSRIMNLTFILKVLTIVTGGRRRGGGHSLAPPAAGAAGAGPLLQPGPSRLEQGGLKIKEMKRTGRRVGSACTSVRTSVPTSARTSGHTSAALCPPPGSGFPSWLPGPWLPRSAGTVPLVSRGRRYPED